MRKNAWQKKIERARGVEREILKWYQKHVDRNAYLPASHHDEYDIVSVKAGNVEIKEDRVAHQTGMYAIEYQDAQGMYSGINKTTAETFVIVDAEFVAIIATETLRHLIDKNPRKREVEMGYRTLEGRKAKGWLIPRNDILYSTYARVLKRWFK